jgi:hypothetical protein
MAQAPIWRLTPLFISWVPTDILPGAPSGCTRILDGQSLLRWLMPPCCQNMGHPALLHFVSGDSGPMGAPALTTHSLLVARLQPLASGPPASSCHPWGRTSPLSPLSHWQMLRQPPCEWGIRAAQQEPSGLTAQWPWQTLVGTRKSPRCWLSVGNGMSQPVSGPSSTHSAPQQYLHTSLL